MARARNIKPSFFRSEQVVDVAFEWRLLFAGLWCLADRKGRLLCRPKTIKMEIFPADSVDIEAGIAELCRAGLVRRYCVEGVDYLEIPKFLEHQNPHPREVESTIPDNPCQASGNTQATPRNDQGNTKELPSPADVLIPDSPIPHPDSLGKALSGKPDVLPPAEKDEHPKAQARQLIDFLNAKAGKAFRQTDANLEPIVARIKEGYTLQDLKTVTARKCREWAADEKMVEYLRPATLYNRTKFNQYIGECVEESV